MTVLADTISPGSGEARIHFPAEKTTLTLGDLWRSERLVSGWLAARGTGPVAMVLSNSSSCAKVLVGAVAAGAHVISIPPPPRGADLGWYARFVAASCARATASTLVVDASYRSRLPPLPEVAYSSYEEILRTPPGGRSHPERFQLTQFSSGSTGDPRGIVLGQEKIVASVKAIVGHLAPEPGDGICSWVPLSHAMGLIGMFFSALAGSGSAWANGGDTVLLAPEMFLRQPACWLEACAEFQSTITSAPNFGFEMAVNRRPAASLDLSNVRACVAGGEPIRVETLARFAKVFEQTGFRSRAISPAYGLSECGLVAGSPTAGDWHVLQLDPIALASGRVVEDPLGFPVASSGRPLPGYQVGIQGSDRIGEIMVGGPPVADAFADGAAVVGDDGCLATGDLGFMADGDLYVVGRRDDMFMVGGRKIYAVDVEAHVGSLPGIRRGRVAAVPTESDELCVVAEHDETATTGSDGVRQLVVAIRRSVRSRIGTTARQVIIVPSGQLPLSASGRLRRSQVRAALLEGSLPVVTGSAS